MRFLALLGMTTVFATRETFRHKPVESPAPMTYPPAFVRMRAIVMALLAVLSLAAASYWVRLGVPAKMADAPTARIACVSYSPYRTPGESPFTKGTVVSQARIAEDLAALSRRFDCVRTYSVGQGLAAVPAIAKQVGMKVLLGAWLSRDPVENAEELALAIEVAKANRDTIRAIVVGNEVLLRGELPQRTLAEHVRAVRAATGLPVTYADVWEFWLKYREVAPAVDFITIHILPYWEDEPVAIAGAIAHVRDIHAKMRAAFPGREFLIGETGWPSAGRQRWQAVPSRVNEARFFREFLNFAGQTGLAYNVIEAFDQPWKRKLEGTVGGYWGLYDDDLNDKFPLTGPVVEEPRWAWGLAAGAGLAIVFVLAGWIATRLGSRSLAPMSWRAAGSVRALFGFFAGAVLAGQARHMVFANRDDVEWAVTGAMTLLALATAWLASERIAHWAAGERDRDALLANAPLARVFRLGAVPGRCLGALQATWLFAATLVDLLLVFDSRYRDFPTLLFAPAVVGFVLLALARRSTRVASNVEIEERLMAWWLVAASALIVAMELPINGSAVLWALACAAFSLSVLRERSSAPEPGPARRP